MCLEITAIEHAAIAAILWCFCSTVCTTDRTANLLAEKSTLMTAIFASFLFVMANEVTGDAGEFFAAVAATPPVSMSFLHSVVVQYEDSMTSVFGEVFEAVCSRCRMLLRHGSLLENGLCLEPTGVTAPVWLVYYT